MRKLVFVLVFCSWVILINSLFSHHWTEYVSAQTVKKASGRAAKYDRIFWNPSEISLTVTRGKKNDTKADQVQSRALAVVVTPKTTLLATPKTTVLVASKAAVQNQTLPTSTKLKPLQSRTVDSLEAKHSHSGERLLVTS